MKIECVTPTFKSGDACLVTNYRPISVLPSFSKILERIMYNRVYHFLTEKEWSKKQFCFQSLDSTGHAILQLSNQISNYFNEKQFTLQVFIDFSKAFNMVEHKILIHKSEKYGINHQYIDWCKGYLNSRK